jgi:hypothetical protein
MRTGDLPILRGGYSFASAFEDGTLVTHATMHRLRRGGHVDPPQGTSVSIPWTLRGDHVASGNLVAGGLRRDPLGMAPAREGALISTSRGSISIPLASLSSKERK